MSGSGDGQRPGMRVVTFKAGENVLNLLDRLAEEEGVSRSEVIRRALTYYSLKDRARPAPGALDREVLAAAATEACVEVLIGRPGMLWYVARDTLGLNGRYRASREIGHRFMTVKSAVRRFSRGRPGLEVAAAAMAALVLYKEGTIKPIMRPNPLNLFAPVCSCGHAFADVIAAIKHVKTRHRTELDACVAIVTEKAVAAYEALSLIINALSAAEQG